MNSRELLTYYRRGDDAAATALFERYVARLTALARGRIGQRLRRRIDPEDVVQSAYRSFFLHAREGDYEVAEAGDLWRLLAAITLHKLHRQVERHTAAKRSLEREENSSPLEAGSAAAEPSAAEVIALCEGLEHALSSLTDKERLALANLLEGRSIEELAAALGKTDRTARRAIARLREKLERQLLSEEPHTSRQPLLVAEPHAPLRYGDYVLEQLLGSGGMGKVFRARERTSGQAVAIKALHKARQHDPRAVALFVQEAQILARLDHPAIVQVKGLGRFPGGGLFLAMDLVDGADLQARLRSGALPRAEALRVTIAIGEAVAHAHQRGVVHCDLKPANVLLDRAGRVFVSDFGFARLIAETAAASLLLGGTLGYVAPELLRGKTPTPAADAYSLGVLLATLFGAAAPPTEDQPLLHGLPPAVARICGRCLARDPRDRYLLVDNVVADLRALDAS